MSADWAVEGDAAHAQKQTAKKRALKTPSACCAQRISAPRMRQAPESAPLDTATMAPLHAGRQRRQSGTAPTRRFDVRSTATLERGSDFCPPQKSGSAMLGRMPVEPRQDIQLPESEQAKPNQTGELLLACLGGGTTPRGRMAPTAMQKSGCPRNRRRRCRPSACRQSRCDPRCAAHRLSNFGPRSAQCLGPTASSPNPRGRNEPNQSEPRERHLPFGVALFCRGLRPAANNLSMNGLSQATPHRLFRRCFKPRWPPSSWLAYRGRRP